MPPSHEEMTAAQDKLRDLFFTLAFDPDNADNVALADEALRELDRLLGVAAVADAADAADASGPGPVQR
jgi:hypothetical protein